MWIISDDCSALHRDRQKQMDEVRFQISCWYNMDNPGNNYTTPQFKSKETMVSSNNKGKHHNPGAN